MRTQNFDRWRDFRSWIDENRQVVPCYWRGQKDPNWALASLFERRILNMFGGGVDGASNKYPYDGRYAKKPWENGFLQQFRDAYLEEFMLATAWLRGPNPAPLETPSERWSLGRHFGLVTPLLDWAESPYIAAFFALSDLLIEMRQSSGCDRSGKKVGQGLEFSGKKIAVYRLFHDEQLNQLRNDGLRIVRPTVHELGRMHGQRGLFTWLDSEQYFELEGFLDDKGCGDLLTQCLISDYAVMTD